MQGRRGIVRVISAFSARQNLAEGVKTSADAGKIICILAVSTEKCFADSVFQDR